MITFVFVFMKLGIISTARRIATIIYIPAVPIDDVDFPIKIPNTPKSKSPNVVFWNPIFPNTGRSIAGTDQKPPSGLKVDGEFIDVVSFVIKLFTDVFSVV